jgi:hypothetical protein
METNNYPGGTDFSEEVMNIVRETELKRLDLLSTDEVFKEESEFNKTRGILDNTDVILGKSQALTIEGDKRRQGVIKNKYEVRKVKGYNDPDAQYFVLCLNHKDERHRSACLKALRTYADEIQSYLPKLAEDIYDIYINPVDIDFEAEHLKDTE